MARRGEYTDLTGQSFGRFIVDRFYSTAPKRGAMWNATCICGNKRILTSFELIKGIIPSCGCLRRELLSAINTTHGESNRTTEYKIWLSMRERCLHPEHKSYKDYGGRGITIAPEWRDFTVFLRDVGRRPSPSHSLDRIDNSEGYRPGNVRWATRKEQMRNTRTNRYIVYNGVSRTMIEWAEFYGIGYSTFKERIRSGNTFEYALRPVRQGNYRRGKQ